MTRPLDKLTAARLWIVSAPPQTRPTPDSPRNQAYLSQALFNLVTVPSEAVPTLSADEHWRVYVNPGWLTATAVPEIGRELAHALWHLLGEHAIRARACGVTDDTARRWRVATDMAVRDLAHRQGLCPDRLPAPLYDDRGRCPSAEELYRRLEDLLPNGTPEPSDRIHDDCGSAADGIRRNYEPEPGSDLPEVTAVQARMLVRDTAEAVASGSDPGSTHAALRRWAQSVVAPRIRWQQIFAGAIRRSVTTTAGRGDYTYRRPSRRTAAMPHVVLPSQQHPVPQVAVVVDTSGSMADRDLARALAELDSILAGLRMNENGLRVFSVDTDAYRMTRVRRASDIVLIGGGGTDMRVGIAAAAAQRPRPELTIVFTDGFTPWPSLPIPGMTVIAALIGADPDRLPATPAWMTRVECIDDA